MYPRTVIGSQQETSWLVVFFYHVLFSIQQREDQLNLTGMVLGWVEASDQKYFEETLLLY